VVDVGMMAYILTKYLLCCYILIFILQPNYSSIIEHCNLWRNYDDIQDSWTSVEAIIDYYGNNQDVIVPNAGPGHWNDPDMVRILSYLNTCSRL
jgi:hypothetical protein